MTAHTPGSSYHDRLVRALCRSAFVFVSALLLSTATVWASQETGPVVSVQPASPTISLDAPTFQVNVFINQVTNEDGLGGYDLFLNFDPVIIQAVSLTDAGFVLMTQNIVVCLPPTIDNNVGLALLSCVTIPLFSDGGPTTTTPQLLATAVFRPVALGTSALTLDGTMLSDPSGSPLPGVTLQNSQVTIVAAPPPSPPTATATPIEAIPTPTAPPPLPPPPPTETPLPTTPPQPQPTLEAPPTATPSPTATVSRVRGTATPTAEPVLPSTGNGPGEGGSWVLPVAGGVAGAAAAAFAAGLGVRAWRRRGRLRLPR